MATSPITSATGSNPLSNLDQQSRMPVTTLDQNDFLKLLVTQMTTQDPMKPMDDLSSFSQLASFSALEQNKATAASMAMIQANSMLGDYVTVTDSDGNNVVGQVSQVQMVDGVPQLLVGGQRYAIGQVTAVAPASVAPVDSSGTGSDPSGTTPPASTTEPQIGTPPGVDLSAMLGVPPGTVVVPTTGTVPVN